MGSVVIDSAEGGVSRPPRSYFTLTPDQLSERIAGLKADLGSEVIILGHHYVGDDLLAFADLRGDSYGLAKAAAGVKGARTIVFCGVHFMAEAADILAPPGRVVVMPDPTAGCPLADMADIDQVTAAWEAITERAEGDVIPVTYVNSSARLKDFVGRHGGAVCTSSNAGKVIDWALSIGSRLFFFPDQHLGRNTCHTRGIPPDQMILWDPDQPSGSSTPERIAEARVILWKGHCLVHQRFTVEQIATWRAQRPGIRVIVHPECPFEVVQASDLAGSTSFIIDQVEKAEPGSAWAIGTEANLVNRLKHDHPDRFVTSLSPVPSICVDMHRNRAPHLLWLMEHLAEGRVINRITVPAEIVEGARIALDRMIEITGG
ncbi:MAG: quinolinate synthase NadA [Bradymonadales bacterium]|nr:quinolinate synthase NadA [Bradymonadales bacterium]